MQYNKKAYRNNVFMYSIMQNNWGFGRNWGWGIGR